jgi:hypothetical protein
MLKCRREGVWRPPKSGQLWRLETTSEKDILLSLYPTVSGHVGWNQNRMRWKYNHSVSTFSAAWVGHYMCFTVQPIPPIKHWQSFRIPYMFFKYSLWRFKHVIYKFELRMMLHILTWIADANWKHCTCKHAGSELVTTMNQKTCEKS